VSGERTLITGVSGFVGRHLAALCAAGGATVLGCGRRATTDVELSAYISADLADPEQAAEVVRESAPERVFHLAAEASVARSWQDPAGVVTANVGSTLNLLEGVRRHARSAPVLVACSGEEYGPPLTVPVDEEHPLRPQNPYAVSKAAVDLAAGFYVDAHGLRIVRTRAFNHSGPGQSDAYVVSSFARQIAEAEAAGRNEVEIVTGNLTPRRDFTDVRDVVRAYLLALERAEPAVYNVCSGRSSVMGDILDLLSRNTALAVRQRTDPALLRENEVMDIRGSHERLTVATGWKPEIALERTLRDTLDWWRERVGAEVAR
jgi:GDP-4-dehydro-6-deoxy-D-mannose reductase